MSSFSNYYVCDLRNYPMKSVLYFRILSKWVGSVPGPVPRAKTPRPRLGPGPWRPSPKPRSFFVAPFFSNNAGKIERNAQFHVILGIKNGLAAQYIASHYARLCALVHRDYLRGTGYGDQPSYHPWVLKDFFCGEDLSYNYNNSSVELRASSARSRRYRSAPLRKDRKSLQWNWT